MRYIGGDEQGFRGFSGVPTIASGTTLLQQEANKLAKSAVVKDLLKNVPQSQIPNVLKGAAAFVQTKLGAQATQFQKDLAAYLYVQAQAGLDALAKNPTLKRMAAVATGTASAYTYAERMVEIYKSDAPLDASGVADISAMGHKITMSVVDIVDAFSDIDPSVKQEIASWSKIGMGCGAAFGSMNPYVAGGACALGIVKKIIDSIGKTTKPSGPRAVFQPTQDQLPLIAADAERLAIVLYRYYNIKGYAKVYQRLQYYKWLDGVRNYGFARRGDVPKGVDMKAVVVALLTELPGGQTDGSPWSRVDGTLDGIGASLDKHYMLKVGISRSPKDVFKYDHDLDVEVLVEGASWARQDLKNLPKRIPLHAFLRAWELIKFFTAMTAYDAWANRKGLSAFITGGVPVQLNTVCDSIGQAGQYPKCRSDWTDVTDSGPGYFSNRCWTSMDRYVNNCNELASKVVADDWQAFEQVAHMRLTAAFSYLHMAYLWGAKSLWSPPVDMIKDVPKALSTDPLSRLRLPYNPREIYWDGSQWKPRFSGFKAGALDAEPKERTIYLAVKGTAQAAKTLAAAAKKQAKSDQMQLLLPTGTKTEQQWAAAKAAAKQAVTLTSHQAACVRAGGTPYIDPTRTTIDVWKCAPKGTAVPAGAKTLTTAAAPGAGGLLLVGAAGLLAVLKFLK
jgi:hypothetical protein